MKVYAEMTDLYCGEANYGWVRRASITVPENATDRVIVRRVKSALGIPGVRAQTNSWGDYIEMKSERGGWAAFITFEG